MKKNLILMLAVMAIVGTFITGCSGSDAKKEAEKIETEVKEDVEKAEEKVDGFEHEFSAKTQSALIDIEAAVKKDIEAGEKDLETIKAEAAPKLDEVKASVEKDAGEAKDEATKVIKESEERLEALFATK